MLLRLISLFSFAFLGFLLTLSNFSYAFEKDLENTNFYPLYPAPEYKDVGDFTFTILKRGTNTGMKLLVLGGIQGDEPGAFTSASILSTHYAFKNAQVTIIPNLNLPSIIARERGSFGDMNRKFANLSKDDPQYDEVLRLQEYILEFHPDIILNLHDGSGFYSEKYISKLRNPQRWGQSCIIDQANIDSPHGNLEEVAHQVIEEANQQIKDKDFYFTVHNTHTNKGNPEMEKTLTWFGVKNNIASYGLEVSKEFNTTSRAFYHLVQLEAFFNIYNIEFERAFPLTEENLHKALNYNIYISFADNRVVLPLYGIKDKQLGYIPLPKNTNYKAFQAIIAPVEDSGKSIKVHYGNNLLTSFKIEEYTFSKESPVFLVNLIQTIETEDGKFEFEKMQEIEIGEILPVEKSFFINHQKDYRINAIGARKEKKIDNIKTEADVYIEKSDFDPRYAVDEANNMYRIEIYKEKEFIGMFIVDFSENAFAYKLQK